MGSSDSNALPALVPLLLGEEVDLSQLSPAESVGLLRGFFAHLQPCHRYLPAKTVAQLAEHVRPMRNRKPDLPLGHVFSHPMTLKGVHKREKCVDLAVRMGWTKWQLREEHAESHHDLLWTSGGGLVVTSSYHSNDVGGTVAMDFVRASDEQLQAVFSAMDYMTGKLWKEIVTNTLAIVGKMIDERQALVDEQKRLLGLAAPLRDKLLVPEQPPSNRRW